MTATVAANSPSSIGQRILALSLTRIVLAAIAAVAPVALVLIGTHALLDKPMRFAWPQVVAALAGIAGYCFYVRLIEKRPPTELGAARAGRELGIGLILGAVLLLSTIGAVALAGSYRINGIGSAAVLVSPLAEMTLVATIEEIMFRGILFRLIERSLGSWIALILSSALFAAAHLPNAEISLLALLFTFVAGLVLAIAYLATRRLWLAIGLHFAWNFASDAIFSLPTSGHPATGLIQGSIAGPAWLTGGGYGVEGSAISIALFAAAGIALFMVAVRGGHLGASFRS